MESRSLSFFFFPPFFSPRLRGKLEKATKDRMAYRISLIPNNCSYRTTEIVPTTMQRYTVCLGGKVRMRCDTVPLRKRGQTRKKTLSCRAPCTMATITTEECRLVGWLFHSFVCVESTVLQCLLSGLSTVIIPTTTSTRHNDHDDVGYAGRCCGFFKRCCTRTKS